MPSFPGTGLWRRIEGEAGQQFDLFIHAGPRNQPVNIAHQFRISSEITFLTKNS